MTRFSMQRGRCHVFTCTFTDDVVGSFAALATKPSNSKPAVATKRVMTRLDGRGGVAHSERKLVPRAKVAEKRL
jgi:hypothetical protein